MAKSITYYVFKKRTEGWALYSTYSANSKRHAEYLFDAYIVESVPSGNYMIATKRKTKNGYSYRASFYRNPYR